MIQLHMAERLDDLAMALAQRLATPMADPMAPEVLVVPTSGMQRWLSLELSRHLGTSGPERCDGVSANIEMIFPGRLAHRVIDPGDNHDPWVLERVAWVLLEILAGSGDPDDEVTRSNGKRLNAVPQLAPGATEWARSRRLADLFDRYLTNRPAMIRAWAAGDDVDGAGAAIEARSLWQPKIWRRVRDRIGIPSPPELLPMQIEALRSGQCPPEVPERVSMFGLTTIPGGSPFLEFLEALGTQREVGLFLHQPSLELATRVHRSGPSNGGDVLLRSADTSTEFVRHPLLASWGRSARETIVVLGDHLEAASDSPAPEHAEGPTTLLMRFQADLRADRIPERSFTPAIDPLWNVTDRSITIHACHGDTRQVEVLRDQILHLLADDPTLSEDDIVVLCPALERFAPVIESVFGPPASQHREAAVAEVLGNEGATRDPGDLSAHPRTEEDKPTEESPPNPLPGLRYRLSDRSLGSTYPLLGALGSLVEILGSRFSDVAILDFASLAPVRQRFGLDDEAISQLAAWVETANVRWGLDASHRGRWGLPSDYATGTWGKALDRLMAGITTSHDPAALALNGIAPIAVEGSRITVAGTLAELLTRLAQLAEAAHKPRPAGEWLALLEQASIDLFDVDPNRAWERQRLTSIFERISEESRTPDRDDTTHSGATLDGVPSEVLLTLADVRHLIGDQLGRTSGRPAFFRGGVTISTPTPLRGIPHRVICLLGMDESAFSAGAPDGDDLMAAEPHLGDRDRRADSRQVLLEAVLAARDHLVLVRNGRDVVTNQEIPPAVVVAEITEALATTVPQHLRSSFLEHLTTIHPRQRFDERNFIPGGLITPADEDETSAASPPWSFDPLAKRGAMARRSIRKPERFISVPVPGDEPDTVALTDLHEFLSGPPKYFLRRVLEMSLPDPPSGGAEGATARVAGSSRIPPAAPGRDLLLSLDHLETWKVRDRLLRHLLTGGDASDFEMHERAGDTIPPGPLGDAVFADARALVEPLVQAFKTLGNPGTEPELVPIDISLPSGVRIVGGVRDDDGHDDTGTRPGPIELTVSKQKSEHLLSSWLDLLVLTAAHPERHWRALHLSQGTSRSVKGPGCTIAGFAFPGDDPGANAAMAGDILDLLVSIHRAGHHEAIPFFAATSRTLFDGKPNPKKWHDSFQDRGDGIDTWVRAAFDGATFEQITRIPLAPHDPPGSATDRATLYAELIWGAYDGSAPAQKVKLP